MMKKSCLFIVFLVGIFLTVPLTVNAQSIQDYRNEIKELEAEKAESEASSAEIQKKIDDANARINEITREIAETIKEQESTKEEIEELGDEIDLKEEEIKDLVAFYQISDSENFYLKFIFGADSFEDFIYRFSVAEQLTEANDQLVDEMNVLIEENEQKVKELEKQEDELDKLDSQVNAEIKKLGSRKKDYVDEALSVDEEIESLEKQIAFFEKEGCSETQDVTTCSLNVPSASGFVRPTPSGYIYGDDSQYGWRIKPTTGEWKFHNGIDISIGYGTTVMATAAGKVIEQGYHWSFGNYIMVAHNVSGQVYTSLYAHLSSISTSLGQVVDRGQAIGAVGSTGESTGPHLHFQVMYGSGWGDSLNPRNLVDLPSSW